MTEVIRAPTRFEAWLLAAEHLLPLKHDLNLILSIDAPGSDCNNGPEVNTRFDAFSAAEGVDPLHTIAETIFPGWSYRHRGFKGMVKAYTAEYEVLKRGEPQRWGTYAYRMLQRRTGDGSFVNPLEILIDKMRSELGHERGGTRRSCYEIGIAEGEYDLPLYDSVTDRRRRRGLPCLSHLSFKLYGSRVHLTAIYRSHDYRYKVPGNLLGLARLQACVAKEVGVEIGSLVVHSTYAYIDLAKGLRAFTNLLSELRDLMSLDAQAQV